MRSALRGAVICAVLPMLTQACAGGVMESAPSASSAPRAPGTQSYGIYGTDSYFKLEWQPDERRGKPLVSGYVTNQWGISVNRVRLRVEALVIKAAGPPAQRQVGRGLDAQRSGRRSGGRRWGCGGERPARQGRS